MESSDTAQKPVVIPEQFVCSNDVRAPRRTARPTRWALGTEAVQHRGTPFGGPPRIFRVVALDTMPPTRPTRTRPLTLSELIVLLLVAWALWAMRAHGQLISGKTAPLAVDDTPGDAFVSPASASRLSGMWAYGAPGHSWITDRGEARPLSAGVLVDGGQWFGGISGGSPAVGSETGAAPKFCPGQSPIHSDSPSQDVRPPAFP